MLLFRSEEIPKEKIEEAKRAIMEHRQRMETDPNYRKESEALYQHMIKSGILLGKDTDD